MCGYEEERRETAQKWWFVLFCFTDGSVFIVFEEDANQAEVREREVSNEVRR